MEKLFFNDTIGNLTDKLIAYWKLEDLTDSFGSFPFTENSNASPYVTFNTNGKILKCAYFPLSLTSPAYHYYLSRNSITSKVNNLGWAGWIYISSTTDSKGCFFFNGYNNLGFGIGAGRYNDPITSNNGWGGSGTVTYPIGLLGYVNGTYLSFNKALSVGWHFIVFTRDDTTWRAYVDDVLCTPTFTNTPSYSTTQQNRTLLGQNGYYGAAPNTALPFNGYIDETMFYERYVTKQNSTDLYNLGNAQPLATYTPTTSARTLTQIADDFKTRLFGKEFLPSFIGRTNDLQNFVNSVSDFISPFVLNYESFLDFYNDKEMIQKFLSNRGIYYRGDESLYKLQQICSSQMKILISRGTKNSEDEIRRLVKNYEDTSLVDVAQEDFGWWLGRTSPGYTTTSTNLGINLCFLNTGPIVIFVLKNQNEIYSNDDVLSILRKYFEPKHIHSYYNFL